MLKHNKICISMLGVFATCAANYVHATESDKDMDNVERIAVTGSRLLSIEAASPSPVTVIGEDLIQASGATDIAELLNKLPSMAPGLSSSTSNYNGNAGMSTQDLRGQGAKRTLTLVNGRRHVGSIPGESTVDISSIPTGLIKRIEILTGGASSVYGADAVAGVINIITKTDYVGSKLNVSAGISSRSDGEKHGFNFLHGLNFNDDKGNATFYFSYDKEEEINAKDRPYTNSNWSYLPNPEHLALKEKLFAEGKTSQEVTDITDNDNIPNNLSARRYSITASPTTVVFIGGIAYTFNADGSMRPVKLGNSGELYRPENGLTGIQTDEGGEQLGAYEFQRLRVPVEKAMFNNTINYEFDSGYHFSLDSKYVKTESESRVFPNSLYGSVPLSRDNAFIRSDLGAKMDEYEMTYLPIARHFTEMGQQGTDYERDVLQIVASLQGTFANNWQWEFYAQYGKASSDNTTVNSYYEDRWRASLDSVRDENGNAVCRATIDASAAPIAGRDYSNCIPHDVFTPMSDELLNYVKLEHTSTESQTQKVAHFHASGDLFETWAGPIALSVGAEYRKESSETSPSQALRDGISASYAVEQPVVGEYDVKDVFLETNIPLLSDVFLASKLNLNLSVRSAHYSEAGQNTSWNVGTVWQPIDDVTLRISRSRSARAPNINEQFTTEGEGFEWLYQPCSQNRIKSASAQVVENCKKLGVNVFTNEIGETTSDIRWYQPGTIVSSGNQDLDVETANTLTAGLVFTPTAIDNLELTFDYWDIKLSGLIDNFNVATVVDSCVEQSSLDNQFCALLTRQPDGIITHVNLKTLNLNQRRTSGLDIIANYKFDMLGGTFAINTIVQRLIRRDIQTDPTLELEPTVGLFAHPEWKATVNLSYENEQFRVGTATRYVGEQRYRENYTASYVNPHETPSMFYTDLTASYNISETMRLNVGANNVFDKKTPQMPNAYSGGANYYLGTDGGLFDTLGRTYFASFNWEF
ncbi:TonB-dependent receptor [Pseudoalteromonas sp. JBTF-M23]|uniref:TonB-dependent receptor n=1 Tax=Pseudoalteromonas caenipelagi TaxID=2726988 RepID=A0A849V992_9GAMM|nr:TonB-dependent receptor [Pseudoalteromonas caenipelagi]